MPTDQDENTANGTAGGAAESQEGFSLDPATLDILRAAEAGEESLLLDEEVISGEDSLFDNTPLVERGMEETAVPNWQELIQSGAPASFTDHSGTPPSATGPMELHAQADAALMEEPPGLPAPDAVLETVLPALPDIDFDEEETPLTQAVLDDIVRKGQAKLPKEASVAQETVAEVIEASKASAAPPPTAPEDAVLTQEQLDALIAGQSGGHEPAIQEEAGQEEALSQAGLDALIAAETAVEDAQPEKAEDTGPLSQADLDALVAAETTAPGPTETIVEDAQPEKAEDTGPLSQADLDALIAAETATPDPTETIVEDAQPEKEEEDGPLSQADLDALIAAETAAPDPTDTIVEDAQPEKTEEDGPLSQADLDALIAAETAAPDPTETIVEEAQPEKTEEEGPLSQSDLDALIAAETAEGAPAGKGDDESLAQGDLDAVLAAAQGAAAADDSDTGITQDDIDSLLAGAGDEQVLDNTDIEALVGEVNAEDDQGDASIDTLLQELGGEESGEEEGADLVGGELSQDMVNALIAAAGGDEEASVTAENLAAAASPPESTADLLSQDDLDTLIEQAKGEDKRRRSDKQRALEEAIEQAQASAAKPQEEIKVPRTAGGILPPVLGQFVGRYHQRIAITIPVGLMVSIMTFTALYLNQERLPDSLLPITGKGSALEVAMERAENYIQEGDYPAAIEELDGPLAKAPPGTLRTSAEFIRLEALYRGFVYEPGSPTYDELHSEFDRVIEQADKTHERVPEALYWKAKLYEEGNLPYAAQVVYEEIISHFPETPNLDQVLFDAAELAMSLPTPGATDAAAYAQQLLNQYPGSHLAGEARLILGDAYAEAGMYDDARTLYLRTAEAEPNSSLGAEAFLRLGDLAYEQRRYDQTIMQLETRLNTATTVEGNDKVLLLLAKAYRNEDRLEDARNALNDLIHFFPENDSTPDALIELSQVHAAMYDLNEALSVAQSAVSRFPDNPDVHRNKGELFGLAGRPVGAAEALVAADRAGANDPVLLLQAARYYRAAGMIDSAHQVYLDLKELYAGTPQALTGGIEAALIIYEKGRIKDSVDQLEDLLAATSGTPQHLPALQAMSKIYQDLGLSGRVVELSKRIATISSEPEVLAQAGLALLDADQFEEARRVTDRIDLGRVKDDTAYAILVKEGAALLTISPRLGLEKLETAYLTYPQSRTIEHDQHLLQAYLAAGRPASARRVVMELADHARGNPEDAPYLIDAAAAWGDYQLRNKDYRGAADTYTLAIEAAWLPDKTVDGNTTDARWPVFQRANALFKLDDFADSYLLFNQVAQSKAPWADEALLKAGLAEFQLRLRNLPVPGLPTAQAES